MTGRGTLTVGATVNAVVDAIDLRSVTSADLEAFAAILAEAVRSAIPADQVADQVDEQAPMFGAVGLFLRANQGLIGIIALVIAALALLHAVQPAARVDPPPAAPAQVGPSQRAEIERIVEERLREQEQQKDGANPASRPEL